jgi:hypothetical protein
LQFIAGEQTSERKMKTMKISAGLIAITLLMFVSAAQSARGQQCPKDDPNGPGEPSESRTLEGKLVFHDGMRKWFELKLDRPECGQESIELLPGRSVFSPGNLSGLETFQGCRVRTEGSLAGPASGYYTLDVNQSVAEIETIGACTRQPPFADYSKAEPDHSIRSYRVEMTINYEQADRPIFFRVTSKGKELQPWQAYATYELTGGYVLYGSCAKGFMVDRVFGDRVAGPQHLEGRGDPYDSAMFDPPEGPAGERYKKQLHVGFTCMRNP